MVKDFQTQKPDGELHSDAKRRTKKKSRKKIEEKTERPREKIPIPKEQDTNEEADDDEVHLPPQQLTPDAEEDLELEDSYGIEFQPLQNPHQPDSLAEEHIELVEFWSYVGKLTNPSGNPIYKNLCQFVEFLMVLPHSNASAERQFSRLKIMKTVLRNRLKPETISSLMHVHCYIPNVAQWKIPSAVVEAAKKWKPKKSK